jgi:NTE family protein
VVTPIRGLASETIDAEAIILGIALPGSIADRIVKAYDSHLFGGATLQDLADHPRFVINATSVQSGVLWRFAKPFGAYLGPCRIRARHVDLDEHRALA